MCTPFIYDGVKYDDCYSGWYGPRCMVNGDGQWLYCGDCIEDTLVTDNKIINSTNEVSKQTSVESSGDYIDDSETSLESTGSSIDDIELDGQLDVINNAKKQSLLCFIDI